MLESIITKQYLCPKVFNGCLPRQVSPGACEDRHTRKRAGDQKRLVACFPGIEENGPPVGNDIDRLRVFTSIAAAEHGGAAAQPPKHLRQIYHAGCFARAADGYVADADDRAGKFHGLQNPSVVQIVALRDDEVIG